LYATGLIAKKLGVFGPADSPMDDGTAMLRTAVWHSLFPLDGNIDAVGPPAGVPREAYTRDAAGMPMDTVAAKMEQLRGRHVDDMLYAFAQIQDYMMSLRVGTVVTPSPFGHKHQVLTL